MIETSVGKTMAHHNNFSKVASQIVPRKHARKSFRSHHHGASTRCEKKSVKQPLAQKKIFFSQN
jgi:hypothetical protein